MGKENFGAVWEDILERSELVIRQHFADNENLMKQVILLMRRSKRMVQMSFYSQNRKDIMPAEFYEKEQELINSASNEIVNEMKRMNNLKKISKKH